MWTLIGTRRIATQLAEAWCYGWGEAMREVYGVAIQNTLIFRDEKKTEYYAGSKEYKAYIAGLKRLLRDKQFLRTFHSEARQKLEFIQSHVSAQVSKVDANMSDRELMRLYTETVLPNQTQFYIRMWTVFQLGEPITESVTTQLRKHLDSETEVTETLIHLAEPLEYNDAMSERRELLRLAVQRADISEAELTKRLEKHVEHFQHIPMFDVDHDPYALEHFRHELDGITEPNAELKDIKTSLEARRIEYHRIVAKFQSDHDLVLLLGFMKENTFLRDYRDTIRQKLNLSLRTLYLELARRLKMSLEEIVTLTNAEIIECLGERKVFSQTELDRRKSAFLLIVRGQKATIMSGDKAIQRSRAELGTGVGNSVAEIHGSIGAPGRARGIVKLVLTNRDLDKFENGDVLVAGMTRQDFVPAMRKAAAIVTDEGGVTCHAAIVARELGVPCVVGTKAATKMLKDGETVEVDADAGVVKKI